MRSTSPLLPGRQHPKGRQARNEAQPANAPHPLMECKPAVIYLIDYCQTDTPPQTKPPEYRPKCALPLSLIYYG